MPEVTTIWIQGPELHLCPEPGTQLWLARQNPRSLCKYHGQFPGISINFSIAVHFLEESMKLCVLHKTSDLLFHSRLDSFKDLE